MTTRQQAANSAWRDYQTDGVASTGKNEPSKVEIRAYENQVNAAIDAALSGQVTAFLPKENLASLNADLAHAAGVYAVVFADATSANNGVYKKIGASGVGSWSQISSFVLGYVSPLAIGSFAFVNSPDDAAISISGPTTAPVLNLTLFRGSKIWATNNAAPLNTLGADGDFAIDRVTYAIYGPKAAGVWPAASMTAAASAASAAASAQAAADAAAGVVGGSATLARVSNVAALRSITPTTAYDVATRCYAVAGDGGEAWYRAVTGAAAGTYVDDGATTILPTGGDGSSAWLRSSLRALDARGAGARGDGTAGQATAVNAVLAAAGDGAVRFPYGSYAAPGIVGASASRLHGDGSLILATADNQTIVRIGGGTYLSLQTNKSTLARDLSIAGGGYAGVTGVGGAAALTSVATLGAKAILENIGVSACEIGFNLGATQFLRAYNLSAWDCTLGMLIRNDTTDGGGNSLDFHQPHFVGNVVGCLIDGTNFVTVNAINFYNPQPLGNSLCGMAFFSASATIYGSAPEYNGGGSDLTAVISGKTVKRSSMYLNASTVNLENVTISEATVDECFVIENYSTLNAHNLQGYGNSSGYVVKPDSTSVVNLTGNFACIGHIQNVGTWPDSITVKGAPTCLAGQPTSVIDSTLQPIYSEQGPLLYASASNPPTEAYIEDDQMGYCRQLGFNAAAGSPSGSNTAYLNIPGCAASSFTLVSMLVRADRDCSMLFSLSTSVDGYNQINFTVTLYAGKLTRIVMMRGELSAGTYSIWLAPQDTSGPVVAVSRLQLYQALPSDPAGLADVNKIVKYGAFSPGALRATAANIQSKTNSVNIRSKFPGKAVWVTDAHKQVFASDRTDTAVWVDSTGATAYTPI
jgi:hypothetical protein